MEIKIYDSPFANGYAVHMERDSSDSNKSYSGRVYPITYWTKPSGEAGWAYNSATSGGHIHYELNDDCRLLFDFSFCWRGVWEGRVYFRDSEYWSEELAEMSELWDRIERDLKARIRQDNPDYHYFDD